MPTKKKIGNEILVDDDNTTVIPVEDGMPTVKEAKVKQKVKREMSEAQRLNMLKVIEANRVRWAKQKEEKAKAEEEAKLEAKRKLKEEQEALIKAGTHIRVKVIPTKKRTPKEKPIQEEETATEEEEVEEFQAPRAREKVVSKRSQKVAPQPYDTDTTETETEDEDYKPKKREVRREIKKNLKALKQIDEVIEQSQGNPYLAYLTQKWK